MQKQPRHHWGLICSTTYGWTQFARFSLSRTWRTFKSTEFYAAMKHTLVILARYAQPLNVYDSKIIIILCLKLQGDQMFHLLESFQTRYKMNLRLGRTSFTSKQQDTRCSMDSYVFSLVAGNDSNFHWLLILFKCHFLGWSFKNELKVTYKTCF